MNRFFNIIFLLAAAFLVSFCKDNDKPSREKGSKMSAEIAVPKGAADLADWFVWESGASTGFFSSENTNVQFSITEGAGRRLALFHGNPPEGITAHETVSAYYPFKDGLETYELEVVPASLPHGLFLASAEVDDPASIELSFSQALPVILFRVKNGRKESVSVKSLSLESSRNVFFEKGKVDMLSASPAVKAVGAKKQSVGVIPKSPLVLAPGASAGVPMCIIPVDPGQFNVVTVLGDDSSVSLERTQAGGFKAGNIYVIEINLTDDPQDEIDLTVVSFNIRFLDDNRPDYDLNFGGQPWAARRPAVKAFFEQNDFDVVGLQEVRRTQVADLKEDLGDDWFIYCPGRISGGDMTKTSDESVGVMYRKERFNCLDYGCFWLSETPNEIASKRAGQDYPMIISWLHLEEKNHQGKDMWFFSCHVTWSVAENPQLPDQEVETLISQIEYLTDIDRDNFKTSSTPIFAVGDFNNTIDASPMQTLEGIFNDARLTCPETASTYRNTYNAYGEETGACIIDFIFYGKGTPVEYLVDNSTNYDPSVFFISDHYPLLFKLTY